MNKRLSEIFDLLKILYKYQTVERAYPTPYSPRLENDIEHSYVLAMLAWYIIEKEKLPLNQEKILKYCLAHDLVEVYTGDVWSVGNADKHRQATKERRENVAQQRLEKSLSYFPDALRYIDGYKKKKDPESKFVYALDKVISNLVISLHSDKGKSVYKKIDVTLGMLNEHKKDKVALHPSIETLWKSVSELLDYNHKKHSIFPTVVPSQKKRRPQK